jgi:prepilin-type N-terminal cleavage/methylation domain-containing protein
MRPVARGKRKFRGGFTLMEGMATVVVLAILGSITSFVILEAVDAFTDAGTSAQLHAEASIAVDRIVRELREIDLDSGASGIAPDIDNVSPSWIDWTDGDGDQYVLGLIGSDVQFQVDGGPMAVLLSNVSAFTVSTFDEDNVQLAGNLTGDSCDPIRRVAVDLTLDRNGVSESMRAKAYIRSTISLE